MNTLIKSVEALSESPIKTLEHLTDFYSVKRKLKRSIVSNTIAYVIVKEEEDNIPLSPLQDTSIIV